MSSRTAYLPLAHLRRLAVARCIAPSLLLLGLLLPPAVSGQTGPVSGKLTVYILSIGQGDAILIVCPHGTHRLLIDAGNQSKAGQAALHALLTDLIGLTAPIQVVVASHPHADHVGSLYWVLSTFRVKKFIDNGDDYTSTYTKIRKLADTLVARKRLKYYPANKPITKAIADFCPASNVDAELLIPKGFGGSSNPNNNSVVVLVRHDDVRLLFTGDAETAEEKLLLADPVVANKLRGVDFYKVGHHGAETSSTAPLVSELRLQAAAISSGCKDIQPNIGYRHPREVVLDRLQTAMVAGPDRTPRQTPAGLPAKDKWTTFTLREQIYVTAADGTVEVQSDGQRIQRVASSVTDHLAPCH